MCTGRVDTLHVRFLEIVVYLYGFLPGRGQREPLS